MSDIQQQSVCFHASSLLQNWRYRLLCFQATGYKAAAFPIAGAVLGTIVAGPVGLFAGAKIGGVIGAVGGGAAGNVGHVPASVLPSFNATKF